ncbi:MAG: alpha-E domain-containing protein [Clostridiales bacterium]|nr:alpha-E domain-containing protein [Clostridiales bacterium]
MGIITVEKSDNLYWLGRYMERAFTTIKTYIKGYDNMIDHDDEYYKVICEQIGIPCIYASKDDFMYRYAFDENDQNSIVGILNHAYDNAIIIRDTIGSDTLSYVQLAVYDLKRAKESDSPVIDLQLAIDHILAFWGCVDDTIFDIKIRNIIRVGKRSERLDLYLRFEYPVGELRTELSKLDIVLNRSNIRYNRAVIDTLDTMFERDAVNYESGCNLLSKLLQE